MYEYYCSITIPPSCWGARKIFAVPAFTTNVRSSAFLLLLYVEEPQCYIEMFHATGIIQKVMPFVVILGQEEEPHTITSLAAFAAVIMVRGLLSSFTTHQPSHLSCATALMRRVLFI